MTQTIKTLKTTLHTFNFDTRNAEGLAAWNAFKKERELSGHTPLMHGPVLSSCHFPMVKYDGQTVELEAEKNLFDNQWNMVTETGGVRVFDYALQSDSAPHAHGMSAPRGVRRGHWLEQTNEMRALRAGTHTCGYCGTKYGQERAGTFCDSCIDSEYLEKKDLHLLRLLPLSDRKASRKPLTQTERNTLEPIYTEGRIRGVTERGKARMAKARADLIASRDKTIRIANTKFDGMTWIMDKGFSTDNVIFYDHMANGAGVFSFGWRKPLDKETTDALLDLMSEFPFEYELVTDHRGKLGNWS